MYHRRKGGIYIHTILLLEDDIQLCEGIAIALRSDEVKVIKCHTLAQGAVQNMPASSDGEYNSAESSKETVPALFILKWCISILNNAALSGCYVDDYRCL